MSEGSAPEVRFKGIPASPGVARGSLHIYRADEISVRKRKIRFEDIPNEINRLENALVKTRQQLQEIRSQLANTLGEQNASIFDAHLLVVEDPTILEGIKSQLHQQQICVDYLYHRVTQSYVQKLRELDDSYLQERATDILDVARRVLRNLRSQEPLGLRLEEPSIVLAHDLTPSDTATMDRGKLLGFATEAGSKTSHTAIMARSLNIPAVVGLRDTGDLLDAGAEVLIDGYEGVLIVNPSEQTKWEYGQIESRRQEVEVKLELLRETVAVTNDGRHVIVSANVELPEDLPLVAENGAEGIGLFRSEYLFLNRDDFPSEEEQFQLYRQVIETTKPHSAIIRTLDVGGDKQMVHLGIESEMNPFLGWRGIRYCLGRPDVFRSQLRAICRASVHGNARIMFPMITELAEVREARAILDGVRQELKAEGQAQAERIEVGIMIEVPSAALTADLLAREVDFFSIGTNDLIQYTLAVDRGNERVSNLYEPTHPAILRLIRGVVEAAHRHHIWVGVCGEMASDVLLIPALVGLGVDELSLGSVFIPRIKRVIQSLNYAISRDMADGLVNGTTAEENLNVLRHLAQQLYPEIL
jgi:phosphotransferase system enzyme I (PtsI)